MRIGMLTWGSHGDIRPFLALADGLQAAGHDVHLVITCLDDTDPERYRSRQGARLTVLAPMALSPEEVQRVAQSIYDIRDPMKQLAALIEQVFLPAEQDMFKAAEALCAESELLVGHFVMYPLQIAAERAGLPYISVLLSHAVVPSAFSHPIGLPGSGKTINRLLWWLTRAFINRAILRHPNRLRHQAGLAPIRDVISQSWLSPLLSLIAVSPQICERQPDWPDSIQVTGFLDMPNIAIEGELSADLARFLESGPPPVFMTFGSWMPPDIPGQTHELELLTRAASMAGYRAIIQSPSPGACGFTSNDQVFYVSAAPHHQVFPQCFAVVHHGGAGTTQSATLAGKPSVIVANISEQEHWCLELHRLGIADKPLTRRKVTPAAIAAQLRHIQSSPSMTEKARAIAHAMRSEDGVAMAVLEINRLFAGQGSA